jgi:dTDP-4-amino-4,6-dideoxygalactose transaminase
MRNITPFKKPLYVSRPLLPDLTSMQEKLKEVWDSQWLTNNGAQHALFEKKIKTMLRVPNVSLFNNGTIALIVACQALRLSGEVITTPFTFPATPHVLSWNNIKPIFCDIDAKTLNINTTKIESMITPQTTAILAVHVFGTPCDVIGIQEIADKYGLKVVYDAAHSFGVEIDGIGIGNYGDISMFSFHATKLFHTAEGGALSFKDGNLKSRIEFLKNFGIKNQEEVVMPGINGKMNEIQAVLGLLVADLVGNEKKKRAKLLRTYQEELKDIEGISIVTCQKNSKYKIKPSYQYFVVRINANKFGRSRDYLYTELKKYNVFARKYFYPLCSDYTCYRNLPSSAPAYLPVAQEVVKEVLCLPFYGGLSANDVMRICSILKSLR